VRTTKRSKFVALAVGLALVAAACSDDKESTTTTAATEETGGGETTVAGETTVPGTDPVTEGGGTVTYAAEQEYVSYNNGTSDQNLFASTLVLNMILPGSFIVKPDLSLVLWDEMMVSAEVTVEDPQTVEYVVKPEAVWSDGDPIDCDDYYMAWLANSGKLSKPNPDFTTPGELDADGNEIPETLPVFNTASTTGYDSIDSVTCSEDGKTITTVYATPYPDWQGLFSGLLPAHVVETNAGVEDIMAVDTAATSPDAEALGDFWSTGFVGVTEGVTISGAWYEFDSFTAGQDLILKRNEAFWGTPGVVDQLVFLQVPDATQQPAALENGDVQVITPQPNPDLVAQIAGMAGVTSDITAGTTWEHYDFNQANKHLAKLAVRQALALCIDRQEIVDTLVVPINPDAQVLNNRVYVPESPDYADNSGDYGVQNIDGAKALLEGAGYTMGDDGVYVDADGERLSLRLGRRDPNPRRQSTNELFAEQCALAGVELIDDPAEDMNSVRLPASDYDIILFAWVASPFQSSNTGIYVPGGDQNYNNSNIPQLIDLFAQANAEFDQAVRADLMNQIDTVLWENMATLPLFQFQNMVAYSDTVSGVEFNDPAGVTWNANEWALAV
jgi:peptide/nickel transport system substrate-binding protein